MKLNQTLKKKIKCDHAVDTLMNGNMLPHSFSVLFWMFLNFAIECPRVPGNLFLLNKLNFLTFS